MIRSFTKETLVKGRPAHLECLEIAGQTFSLSRGLATVLQLEDDWYEDLTDPEGVISTVKSELPTVDIFTFWQRLPDVEPRFTFPMESETLAVLRIENFEYWWNKQIKSRTRNLIRKAEKAGVEVREAAYDDDFVRGMTDIFNETPIRQGRRFWHYGKSFETVKSQFSRYLFREDLIGAYYCGALVGFLMLGNAGRYAVTGQIISKIEHREKAVNNALIAKAVELCARKRIEYLVYSFWDTGSSLTEFKRRCGFEKVNIPRYYLPLTLRGRAIVALGLQRGWRRLIPGALERRLRAVRTAWLTGGSVLAGRTITDADG